MANQVTHADVAHAIQAAGLANSVIALHSSLSSFGHLEGGADALINAFLQAGCTLLVPTFTYFCEAPPQREIAQNGFGASYVPDESGARVFDPAQAMISPEMGSIPARILATPGRVRGPHALNSFAALGPLAGPIISGQDALCVYAPYQWLYEHPPAFLLLLGVDLMRATPIHFAEQRARRRLFRRWGLTAGGVVECETGSCSEGFNKLLPAVEPIERRLLVGPSLWRIYSFSEFVERVSIAIRADAQVTHCDDPDCARCRDAALGGPLL